MPPAVVLALFACALQGTAPAIAPGTGVRITLAGEAAPLEGRLTSMGAEGLELTPAGETHARSIRWEVVDAIAVPHRRKWAGLGTGMLGGAAVLAAWSVAAGSSAREGAVGGAVLGLPAAALGVALGGTRSGTTFAALAAGLAYATAGVYAGGACAIGDGSKEEVRACVGRGALLGATFGAVTAGLAAHVSRRHWMPMWARQAAVGVVPTRRGTTVVMRLAF